MCLFVCDVWCLVFGVWCLVYGLGVRLRAEDKQQALEDEAKRKAAEERRRLEAEEDAKPKGLFQKLFGFNKK